MPRRYRWTALVAGTLALIGIDGCTKAGTLRRQLLTPAEVAYANPQSPYLKAHMRSGDVYVLSGWQVDTIARTVSGTGQRLDRNRRSVVRDVGRPGIAIDDLARLRPDSFGTDLDHHEHLGGGERVPSAKDPVDRSRQACSLCPISTGAAPGHRSGRDSQQVLAVTVSEPEETMGKRDPVDWMAEGKTRNWKYS